MNEANTNNLKQHIDILSFRDLAQGSMAFLGNPLLASFSPFPVAASADNWT